MNASTTPRAICAPATTLRTGGALLHQLLQQYSVNTMFGHTGAVLLPLLDELAPDGPVRFIVARHERSAGAMALGYARQTGKPGVLLVTSGPGATNTLAPIEHASRTATPLVVLTGQVATTALGKQAFQEADITGMARPLAKWTVLARSADELPGIMQRAFDLATSDRPGPVLIDLPKDVLSASSVIWPGGPTHDWRAETPPAPSSSARPAIADAAAYLRRMRPHATIVSDVTPGFALPSALGMAAGGAREVFAIDTASSWLHSALEFCTARQRGLPVKAVLVEPHVQIAALALTSAMHVAAHTQWQPFLDDPAAAVLVC